MPIDKVRMVAAMATVAIVILASVGVAVSISDVGDYPYTETEEMQQFIEICSVPRYSGYCEKIGQYLMDFAEEHNLDCEMDDVGNVRIDHPGNRGGNVILQAHMDMVAECDKGIRHDWNNDGIETVIENGLIHAKGTTLGADDGCGIAIALCALKSDEMDGIAFRCIFTVDEETDGKGAKNVSADWLKGYDYLINVDSENDNRIIIGAAGSMKTFVTYKMKKTPSDGTFYKAEFFGLIGGHSGDDIDKGRANAILLIVELMDSFDGVRLVSLDGGIMENSIPERSIAVFSVPQGVSADAIKDKAAELAEKYAATDPDIKCEVSALPEKYDAMSESDTEIMLDTILSTPNGVLITDERYGVITSSNIGKVKTVDDCMKFRMMSRSFFEEEMIGCCLFIKDTYESIGAEAEIVEDFYGWIEDLDSEFISIAAQTYHSLYGYDAEIAAERAALECGFFVEKYPELQQISIGPNIHDCHTTKERMEIDSFSKCKRFTFELLKALADR